MTQTVFYLIANAHLDPVWMWDWREGFNVGLTTVRTVLDLMDERPELTFIRGEAAIYRFIEETDPQTFARIRAYVENGRWDVVGGVWVQPDTNMPATETFCRHFDVGTAYFQERFGARPRVAWAADSFGFGAGLPEILANAGMHSLAFTRPFEKEFHLEKPAFWWIGKAGAKILAYRPPVGVYTCERWDMPRLLDENLARAGRDGLRNIAVFYGLGDHGGGPTRRLLDEIDAWQAAHPEVQLVHSGLHRFFAALHEEVALKENDFLPFHLGEMNFCLRGCYASAARVKFTYRRLEALASRAETASSLARAAAEKTPLLERHTAQLQSVWEDVLFNSFHDILPGSSTESALQEQVEWMNGGLHVARRAEFEALNALAQRIDSSVPEVPYDKPQAVPFLLWNPQPQPFSGWVELETCLDDRPLFDYANRTHEVPIEVRLPDGTLAPFQNLALGSDMPHDIPWRYRALVPVEIPALGYSVVSLGYVEGAPLQTLETSVFAEQNEIEYSICNETFRVTATIGATISLQKDGAPWTGDGLRVQVMNDRWGSWGDFGETDEGTDIQEIRENWRVVRAQILERGPLRASLWVRLQNPDSGRSWIDLTFSVSHGRRAVDVAARLLWNERAARLKIGFPLEGESEKLMTTFDVPGGETRRAPCGEVPARRWARVERLSGVFGFASNAIYNFQVGAGVFSFTPLRATLHASEPPQKSDDELWRPTVDAGELKFQFLLTDDGDALPRLARELETPVVVQQIAPRLGDWPRRKSLASLQPSSLELLALAPRENGLRLRVLAHENLEHGTLTLLDQTLILGALRIGEIATFDLQILDGKWAGQRLEP